MATSSVFVSGYEEAAVQPTLYGSTVIQSNDFETATQTPTLYGSTVIQSNDFETAPSTVDYFHSIGTEALGTLAAWTTRNGSPSIAANIADSTATASLSAGHADWADGTWTVRFQANSNNWFIIRNQGDHISSGYAIVFNAASGFNLYKITGVGGAGANLATMATGTIVNGAWYWARISASGTTISASYYADSSGVMGAQIGTTVSATDSTWTSGLIEVYNSKFGGAFANVCYVTGPAPSGCATMPNNTSSGWAAANEPAFCWSKVKAYYGSASLSIYQPIASSPASSWQLPSVASAGTQRWNVWYQAGANNTTFLNDFGTGVVASNAGAQTSFVPLGASYTRSATVNIGLGATTGAGGGGTVYFDYATIVQPNSPTQVMFSSLGSGTLGTLAAWTNNQGGGGTYTISGNVASAPAGANNIMSTGHSDWGDGTLIARFPNFTPGQGLEFHSDGTGAGHLLYVNALTSLQMNWSDGGTFNFAFTSFTPTSGSAVWLRIGASGSTYTLGIAPDCGGYPGAWETVSTTHSTGNTTGKVGVRSNVAGAIAGGNYPNVFIFQSNVPTGWIASTTNWSSDKEPAYCWSQKQAYYGSGSLSVYFAVSPGGNIGWAGPAVAVTNGQSYVVSAWGKSTGTQSPALYAQGALSSGGSSGGTATWQPQGPQTVVASSSGNTQLLLTGGGSGTGTVYFDYATIVQPTTPTGVLFNSLGAPLGGFTPTGTLGAWQGLGGGGIPSGWSISSGQVAVTYGANVYTGIQGGHRDWGDGTLFTRLQMPSSGSANSGLYVHANGVASTYIQYYIGGGSLACNKNIGGGNVAVGVASTPTSGVNNGAWCWLVITCAGTNYTSTIYKDAGGYIGDQVCQRTDSITDSVLQAGQIGLVHWSGSSGDTAYFGGNYPGTFLVQGPLPTGWSVIADSGEPAFCWSKTAPYAGSYSGSIYSPAAGHGGRWRQTFASSNTVPDAFTGQVKMSGAGTATVSVDQGAGMVSGAAAAGGSWNQLAVNGFYMVPGSHTIDTILAGAGTVYFDALNITYSSIPEIGMQSWANAGRQGLRASLQFGGLAVPVGNNFGSALSYIDLNDGVVWYAQDIILPDSHELELAQQIWRGKQSYAAEDWGPLVITVPFLYHGVNGNTIWTARQLMTYGEQILTFDGVHGYYARLKSMGRVSMDHYGILDPSWDGSGSMGQWWKGELEFVLREPFLKTIAQSSLTGTGVTGAVSPGGSTTYSITNNGTFFSEPKWTLNVPSSSTQTVTQLVIANTTSGETATVNLSLAGGAGHTVVLDASTMTVTADGNPVDIGGSFPMLYPGINSITVTLVASGAVAGSTLDCAWTERWA